MDKTQTKDKINRRECAEIIKREIVDMELTAGSLITQIKATQSSKKYASTSYKGTANKEITANFLIKGNSSLNSKRKEDSAGSSEGDVVTRSKASSASKLFCFKFDWERFLH